MRPAGVVVSIASVKHVSQGRRPGRTSKLRPRNFASVRSIVTQTVLEEGTFDAEVMFVVFSATAISDSMSTTGWMAGDEN
jgi:hypothetical protein